MAKIGVAISGGGHRAALFGLGVLLYLIDVGHNKDVVTISSVSGGSIINAHAALNDFRKTTPVEYRVAAAEIATRLARRGTFFSWWGTWVYLILLVLVFVAVVSVWWLPLETWLPLATWLPENWWVPDVWVLRLMLFVICLVLWDWLLLEQRGVVCGKAYAATVFRSWDRPKLEAVAKDDIDHVICATHLHAGEHFYFSGNFVYAYRFGWGVPGGLPLHVAVQASTALPGAFPPRWLRSSRFGFKAAMVPKTLALVDGGVYDNMADQWLSGMSGRSFPDSVQEPKQLIIANASSSMGMKPVGQFRIPLLGPLLALGRDVSIMYDNSASIRKQDLIAGFDVQASQSRIDDDDYSNAAGCVLDIASDPFKAAEIFIARDEEWPGRARRSRSILQRRPRDWISTASEAAVIETSLSKIGVDRTARLLHHAYTLAAMNLHLFLNLPLVDVPSLDDFYELVGGRADSDPK